MAVGMKFTPSRARLADFKAFRSEGWSRRRGGFGLIQAKRMKLQFNLCGEEPYGDVNLSSDKLRSLLTSFRARLLGRKANKRRRRRALILFSLRLPPWVMPDDFFTSHRVALSPAASCMEKSQRIQPEEGDEKFQNLLCSSITSTSTARDAKFPMFHCRITKVSSSHSALLTWQELFLAQLSSLKSHNSAQKFHLGLSVRCGKRWKNRHNEVLSRERASERRNSKSFRAPPPPAHPDVGDVVSHPKSSSRLSVESFTKSAARCCLIKFIFSSLTSRLEDGSVEWKMLHSLRARRNPFLKTCLEIINHLHPLHNLFLSSPTVESYNGSSLRLPRLERRQMGPYLCIAQNDVPPAVSKRVLLNVHCELMNFN